MRERDLFIDGRWRAAASGRRLDIHDPATGELVGSTAIAQAADVDDSADYWCHPKNPELTSSTADKQCWS